MNKLAFFIIFGFLVFGLFEAWVVFGCGCDDSSCTCGYKVCDPLNEKTISDILYTWYGALTPTRYDNIEHYSNKRSFEESDCVGSGECNCHTCGCDDEGNCDICCDIDYDCEYNYVTCQEWENCNSPSSCGDSGSCTCNSNYCKGWCKYKATNSPDEVPVYDGPSFANCGTSATGDCSSLGQKYQRAKKTYSNPQGSSCTCSWCEIKNYYECDSSKINDSHPCASKNCAPDFENGRAYCCPSGMCSHLGNDITLLDGTNTQDASVNPNLYCYSNGAKIRYEGVDLKCNNGKWQFDVTPGETIYDFPFSYDEYVVYPSGYGYHGPYSVIYPLSFDSDKKVVAYISNASGESPNVEIEIADFDTGTNVSGTKVVRKVLKKGEIRVKPTGPKNNKNYNLHVEVYIPKGKQCKNLSGYYQYECEPGTFCIENSLNEKGYCCSARECAYSDYPYCIAEGYTTLHDPNAGAICKRRCSNSQLSGLGIGENCTKDCDCGYATTGESGELAGSEEEKEELNRMNLACKETLIGVGTKICCPENQCGVESGSCCTPGKDCKIHIKGMDCDCVKEGSDFKWKCTGIKIKRDINMQMFTKDSKEYIKEFDLSGLSKVEKISATLLIYLDKGNFGGDLNIYLNSNSIFSRKIPADGLISKTITNLDPSSTSKYLLNITADNIQEDEYFIYLGSTIIFNVESSKLNYESS